MSVVLVVEFYGGRQDLLPPEFVGLHVVLEHQFKHLPIAMVEYFLTQFSSLVDEITEVF